MKIYRIENQETMHGMWYLLDGTFDLFIFRLTEGISRDLPMGFDERFSAEGKKWFSGCDNFDDMRKWFSTQDARELAEAGYSLYEFESAEYKREPNQMLFTREGVSSQIIIPLSRIWH